MRSTLLTNFLLVLILVGLAGCSTAAPGVTNQAGTYVAAFEATPDKVAKAAEQVCKDLKLTVISSGATALDGLVEARTARNKSVTIKITRLTDTQSEVSVRVGMLGDGDLSVMILQKIQARL